MSQFGGLWKHGKTQHMHLKYDNKGQMLDRWVINGRREHGESCSEIQCSGEVRVDSCWRCPEKACYPVTGLCDKDIYPMQNPCMWVGITIISRVVLIMRWPGKQIKV